MAAGNASPPTAIAVFDAPSFPYFGTYAGLTPPDMVTYLKRIGLTAELLDPSQLADADVLNAQRFCCLVHLYGNTFPLEAAENFRRFRRAGGGLIATSVPYCHPCWQVGAADWRFVSAESDAVERTGEGAHSGRFCLQMRKDSRPNWTGAYSARQPTSPSARYRVAAWVRTEGALGAQDLDRLYLRFWTKGGEFLGQWGPRFSAPSAEWQLISEEVAAPERTAAMDVCPAFWASPATLRLDDVVLAEASRPERNLLANPGFEWPGGEWLDLGHDSSWLQHDQIGIGGFYSPTPARGPLRYHADRDPLRLGLLDWRSWERAWQRKLATSQALDPRSLPAADEVISIADYEDGGQTWPILAIIRHHCPEFDGAIDVWAGVQLFSCHGLYAPVELREVVARAAAYIGSERGGPSPAQVRSGSARRFRTERPPRDLEPVRDRREFGGIFPKSPKPAAELVVADVRQLPLDVKFLLTSLQGLVNRSQPRLYLIIDQFPCETPTDERWLKWLQERGDVRAVRRVSDPMRLLREFRADFRGLVVTDPAVPATVNVATMIAGLDGLLIASSDLAASLRLPIAQDLRGRWDTNAAALRWAVDELWPKLSHHALASSAPDWPYLVDYLVAHRLFTFWITGPVDGRPPAGSPLEEQSVIERLLAEAPANIGVLGAPYNGVGVGIQEGQGVTLLSRYAKFLAWSAQNGNLSVHSGTTQRAPFRATASPCPPLHRDKVYITLLVSDGDAPINWYAFFPARYWDDPERGKLPLTWSVGPSVYDLVPDLMDYYYSRANENDCFVAACSGAGYCYPDFYADAYARLSEVFRDYLLLTSRYMRHLDLGGVWTHSATSARLAAFAARVPEVEFLLPDYGRLPTTTAESANEVLPRDVPAFHAVTTFNPEIGPEATMRLMLDDVRRFTPKERPAFVHVFVQCYPWTPTLLRQMLDQLGPEYVPVRADHLAALQRKGTEPFFGKSP
jgi:hypothetical protein